MSFNLDPPPGFRGLDEYGAVTIYIRNLPHWRQSGASYFVTFHLADALPAPKRQEFAAIRREWELRNPMPRSEQYWTAYAKAMFAQAEKWMDAGYGSCLFRQPLYAAEMRRAILHFHKQRYEIGAYVIMANHCHLIFRPFENCELEGEIGAMKGVVAKFVNRRQCRRGELWFQESYDRIIRDEEHLFRVVQYIGANPHKAEIPRQKWNRWINPEWKSLGWDFHDG